MGCRVMVWAVTAGKAVAGDPIEVIPDSRNYSDFDKSAYYSYILHFPDLPYEKAKQMLEPSIRPATEGDKEFNSPDLEDRFVTLHKKRWRMKVEQLSVSTSKELFQMGTNIDGYLECKEGVKDFSSTDKVSRSLALAEHYK